MKLYVLNTGYLETDKNNVVAGATVGTRSNPHVYNEWIQLPVMSFLIETKEGYIIYDLGSNPDAMDGYWPENLREVYPLYQSKECRLENQLALVGVKPTDIHTVILSHMHLDHAGRLDLFPHADVYVPKGDFYHSNALVRMNADPCTHGGYIKADMNIQVKQFHMIEDDFEFMQGIDIINLPGHVPALLGLVLHLKGGTIILPQDAVYTSEIYGPPPKASGLMYDSIGHFKSIEKVRRLQKKYNAKVIFAHDAEFFKTLKLVPDFYE